MKLDPMVKVNIQVRRFDSTCWEARAVADNWFVWVTQWRQGSPRNQAVGRAKAEALKFIATEMNAMNAGPIRGVAFRIDKNPPARKG